jgi:TonB family protein
MRRTLIALLTLFLVWATSSAVRAQDTKPSDQKPTTPATANDTEHPKNEVEHLLDEARKHGEPILGVCIDKCGDDAVVTEGNLERGRAITLVHPAYPPLARAAHAQGEVKVQVIIDTDGKVIAAAAVSGHPLLYGVSVQAARDSVFTPTKLEGKPVKVTGVIQYNFVAQ